MLLHEKKPLRSWREIAEQLTKEQNPNKAADLAEELSHALAADNRQDQSPVKNIEAKGAA